MAAPKFTVGQRVYAVLELIAGRRATVHREPAITKVGRRWCELERMEGVVTGLRVIRFDAATGMIDGAGFSSPGRVWPSEAAYLEVVRRQQLWSCMANKLGRSAPPVDEVPTADIEAAAKLLRVELPWER